MPIIPKHYLNRGWKWYASIPLMALRVLFRKPKALRLIKWRAIQNQPRRDVTIKTKNGVLTVDSGDHGIGARLFIDREYELDYLESSLRVLRKHGLADRAGTFLDIGANIGMMAIGTLKHELFQKAIAIEPGPNNFRLLKLNAAQNNMADRLTCYHYALSSKPGTMELEISDENCGDNRLRVNGIERQGEIVSVDVTTLDHLSTQNPDVFDGVSVIWLDIQGHEGYFFQGAGKFLSANPVPIVCEVWPHGIDYAGMTPDEYIASIPSIYSQFYLLRNNHAELLKISKLRDIFTEHQDDTDDEQIILMPM